MGPSMFPMLVYVVFNPAAYPCRSPAELAINVLTVGRKKALKAKNKPDTTNK
ncbi:hypothetical protein D3C76_1537760 [compost metagenome]